MLDFNAVRLILTRIQDGECECRRAPQTSPRFAAGCKSSEFVLSCRFGFFEAGSARRDQSLSSCISKRNQRIG